MEDDASVSTLIVTVDDFSQLPPLEFVDRQMSATVWFVAMQEHPHVIALQLLEDGERSLVWTREGLSTIDTLKALGM